MAAIAEAPIHTATDPALPRVPPGRDAPAPTPRVRPRLSRLTPRLVAAGGGALAALATPPWGLWPLGIAGIAVLAVVLAVESATSTWRSRWLTGFWWAAAMFAVTLFWMSEFHAVGYVAAFLGYAAFYATAVAVLPLGPDGLRWGVALLPAALTSIEWVRHRFPFGGVPLGSIEIGQAGGPLAPVARIAGGLGVLFLAATLGTALAVALAELWRERPTLGLPQWSSEGRTRPQVVATLVTIAVLIGADALGAAAPDGGADGEPLRVGIVQGGGERGLRAVYTDSSIVFERHRDVAERLDAPLDLVVWPENAVDVATLRSSDAEVTLTGLARDLDATVVAGVTEDADGDRFVNTAYAWGPDGRQTDSYIKVKRVPFGEYVPGRALFERLVDLSILPRDAAPGRGPGVLDTPVGPLGVAISYEVFFADRARDAVRAGAEVLLVPTNASSFTTSQVPTQQVAAARLRAFETGRWVVQAAPTGYSAIIDPDGRVVARSVLGRGQALLGTVARRDGATSYSRWGDIPVVGGSFLALGLATAAVRRRRTLPAGPPPT